MTIIRNASSLLVLFLCSLFGCGKESTPDQPPKEDSLSTGWSKIATPIKVLDLFFIDNNTGFMPGSNILKTTNGGSSWTTLSLPVNEAGISNMYFIDANYGWLVGRSSQGINHLFRTTDGGNSFTYIEFPSYKAVNDVRFIDKKLGFVVGEDQLFLSIDSGKTWTPSTSKLESIGSTLLFTDADNGFVITSSSIYRTKDGGKTLSKVQSFPTESVPLGVHFVDKNNGWVPFTGGLFKTIDGGQTWTLIPVPGESRDVHFFNQQEGYLLQRHAILKTIDGGNTFTREVSTPTSELYELQFTDTKHGWAVSPNGYLYRYLQQ